jgi:hypothetical protein
VRHVDPFKSPAAAQARLRPGLLIRAGPAQVNPASQPAGEFAGKTKLREMQWNFGRGGSLRTGSGPEAEAFNAPLGL